MSCGRREGHLYYWYEVQTPVAVLNETSWFRLKKWDGLHMTVQEVEGRLTQVKCAICKSNRFGIDSRTVNEGDEWKAICRDCYYTFPVHTDMEFYLRTQPDVPYRLRDIACPYCEKRGVTLNFRIVMSVRDSIYFVTCKNCQKEFPERSSLEAFE